MGNPAYSEQYIAANAPDEAAQATLPIVLSDEFVLTSIRESPAPAPLKDPSRPVPLLRLRELRPCGGRPGVGLPHRQRGL